ncbi:Methylitaconate delta2-delta3-isomerase [Pseudozyma hubeiensis]|nr:Methylitaconate delta2-delta3-isomerase [Pseudozyma hubeiensis]
MLLQPTSSRHFEDFRHVEPAILTKSVLPVASASVAAASSSKAPYFERRSLNTVIMRAGTSKGLFIKASDLPASRSAWQHILPSIMGSPDPFGRQLNGLGGGTSTTSKICVVSQSTAPQVADVDYLFIQCPIEGEKLDFTGNCGNMLSGVGPFAFEEGLIPSSVLAPLAAFAKTEGNAREEKIALTLRCLNNNQLIRSTFLIRNGKPVEFGEIVIDGVAGTGSPIQLDFLDPAGSLCSSLCPTGKPVDLLQVPGEDLPIEVSCVDAANPFVFVRLSDIDDTLRGDEPASVLERHSPRVELIRQSAAVIMGLAPDLATAAKTKGTPKICLVADPLPGSDAHVLSRSFSMGRPHPALQLSGAVCLAAACSIPGAIPNQILLNRQKMMPERLKFAHACGAIEATADVEMDSRSEVGVVVRSTSLFRTARRLASAEAYYLSPTQ